MKIKDRLLGLSLLVLISAVLWIGFGKTVTPVPDTTFTTITGKKIALHELRGKPVLVTFWATDCPGCMEEIPHLIDLYRNYHDRGLEIIAVAMYYDPPNHVVTFTKDNALPYDVALDLQAEHARAFGDVRLTPTTFLITPDGSIALQKIGAFDPDDMKTRIETLLKG
ncbi:MAG: TlpA family protein disulfide reductase [Methylobacter sp.]|uniref:peroxiredoxin family protein n=1 Tax=Methylobacter sp. TaxID=2051955 RepID=UPI0025864ADF|nr:TlpA disulfide reductase family protein [Methylobacter sp.]MCL7422896.1 TlpA family protein disulfide reductase [Methylobacter sp.]